MSPTTTLSAKVTPSTHHARACPAAVGRCVILLSASYHNTMGYYRDDTALMQLILDEKGQQILPFLQLSQENK